MNQTLQRGKLAKNPEIHGENEQVVVITLCVRRKWQKKGKWQPYILDYHRCLCVGQLRKFATMFRKGDFLTLRGQLVYKKFDVPGHPGVKAKQAEIWVQELDGKPSGGELLSEGGDAIIYAGIEE